MKTIFRLLQGITLNHDGDYCCMDCLYSFRTRMLISLRSTTAAESAADPGIHEKMLGCGDSGSGTTLKYQNKE